MKITPQIFKKFPKLVVGVIKAENIDNIGTDADIYHLLEEIENLVKLNIVPEQLSEHGMISPWRVAHADFGSKASKYHSSVESLVKRVLKGDTLRINKFVDIYQLLSLKHLVPVGADDLEKVEGQIQLVLAKGDELFYYNHEIENPEKGEVIYKDDKKVLCRKWNWKGTDKTRIEEHTTSALMYVEGLPPITREKVEEICLEAVELIKMFCKADVSYQILDMGNPELI